MLVTTNQEYVPLKDMRKAVTDLILYFAFAGYMVLGESVRITQSQVHKTAATDGRRIFYNPQWWHKLPRLERTFVLLHEWLHIFHNHFGLSRKKNRDDSIWGIAIDIWTNGKCEELLSRPGAKFKTPHHGIQPAVWARNLTVEQIYDVLAKDSTKMPSVIPIEKDQHLPPPLHETESEQHEWEELLRQDVFRAVLGAEASGQKLPDQSEIYQRIDKVQRGRFPWASVFRGTMQQDLGWDTATWAKPKRSLYGQGIIMPTYRAIKERVLLLGVDISGSIDEFILRRFAGIIEGAAQYATQTVVVTFDQILRERVETKRPAELLRKLKFSTGHHTFTDVRPFFAIADEIKPSAIAVLTDCYLEYPKKIYPKAIFITPEESSMKPPWGRHIIMQDTL